MGVEVLGAKPTSYTKPHVLSLSRFMIFHLKGDADGMEEGVPC